MLDCNITKLKLIKIRKLSISQNSEALCFKRTRSEIVVINTRLTKCLQTAISLLFQLPGLPWWFRR